MMCRNMSAELIFFRRQIEISSTKRLSDPTNSSGYHLIATSLTAISKISKIRTSSFHGSIGIIMSILLGNTVA